MSDEKRPHYTSKKEREQNMLLRTVAELIKQLADAAPKIDHSVKVVKRDDH